MRPVDVVLGATYDHARAHVLANPDTIPVGARIVSASAPVGALPPAVGRIVIVNGAQLGKNFDDVHNALTAAAARYARPLS